MRCACLALVVTTVCAGTAQAGASPLTACAPPAGEAWTQERLLCLYSAGVRHDRLPEARARLQRLGAGTAAQPWPTLVLGYATQREDERRAAALYEIAASGFAAARDAEGEVLARHNLRNIHHRRGEPADAARQVARAVAAARDSAEALPIARAAVLEAGHLIETGGDLGRAYRSLRRAERFAFPRGALGLRRTILLNLANASLHLGRVDEAVDALERHRALRQVDGSTSEAATVAFNLLNARLTQNEAQPRPGARAQLTAQAFDVLAEAQRLARPEYVARTHRVLADLLRTSDPDAAAAHLRRCLELAVSLVQPELRAGCLWTQSLLEAARDPGRAEQTSRDAIDALAANENDLLLAYAWQARLRLVWQTMPEEDAIAASLEALDAVERLRARQPEDGSRASVFSHWTRDYYWLSGRLLDAAPRRVAQAFDVGERLRARVLLEHLAREGRAAPAPAMPFASLDAVRQALDEREAMLWYSVAPWEDVYGDFGGGAWLVSVTRRAVRVHRLPASPGLDAQVAALGGLLRDRDVPPDRWEPAAARLGGLLLGAALAQLPPDIRRAVIVSDGPLHRLPFEALRPVPGQPRLGERFEVAVVPSATLWLHLRRTRTAAASGAALVLADPEPPRAAPPGDVRLAPLPWARHEAAAIARTLRLDAGDVHEGGAASERLLKETPLERFAVLHLAAHARADEAFPDRSAVFLAPGGAGEDGWLQPAEIAALDLRGRLVVLSACDSATGFVLSGEGPLSLARAFFAAGADAVVATRWPLRDDDAAFVMDRFYRALRSGADAAAALRRARRDAIDRGLPAAVWAGFALLGDGHRPPIEAPPAWASASASYAAAFGVIAILAALAVVAYSRPPRSPHFSFSRSSSK